MANTAADILIDTLCDWDVQVIFGMPGDGINGIMEALRTRQERIRFVQVRHEEKGVCQYFVFVYDVETGKRLWSRHVAKVELRPPPP